MKNVNAKSSIRLHDNAKYEVIGSQILIFNSGGAQIRRHISRHISHRSASYESEEWRTKSEKSKCLAMTGNHKTNVPADLHELLSMAKNLPEYIMRIFDPLKIPLVLSENQVQKRN